MAPEVAHICQCSSAVWRHTSSSRTLCNSIGNFCKPIRSSYGNALHANQFRVRAIMLQLTASSFSVSENNASLAESRSWNDPDFSALRIHGIKPCRTIELWQRAPWALISPQSLIKLCAASFWALVLICAIWYQTFGNFEVKCKYKNLPGQSCNAIV